MKKVFIIKAIMCFFLVSCGFHLKGTQPTIKQLPKIVQLDLEVPNQDLYASIENAFQQQDVTLSPKGQYKIYLSDFKNEKYPIILSEQQKGRTKEVVLTDGFHAKIFQNERLINEREINSQMVIRYRSSAYLGSSLEEDKAHQRLILDNVEKLLRFLQVVVNP